MGIPMPESPRPGPSTRQPHGQPGLPQVFAPDASESCLDKMAREAVAWLPLDAKTMATDGQKSHRG